MLVYKDIWTKDDVLSNAFEVKSEYEDAMMSVVSKMINPDDLGKVDIGCGNEFGGGDEEENDPNVVKVNNIINGFNLSEYIGSKKDVAGLFKKRIDEMRELLKDKPDRLKLWEKGGPVEQFVKYVFGKFDECQFFMGSRYSPEDDEPKEGMFIIATWINDSDSGETFFYFKDCLKAEKC